MNKKALILGVSGQDGYYLSKLLDSLGYDVFGLCRENSKLHPDLFFVKVIDGDLTDHSSLLRAFEISQPCEVYNFAGFSHIGRSFHQPEIVVDVNTLGVVKLLEIIKTKFPNTKMLQASSYEVFAGNKEMPINENSPIKPVSPYSISKAAADEYIKLYRKNYGLKVCSAYLGNHESPFRQEHFVTRKISKHLGKLKNGLKLPPLALGYLDARRNFGFAGDYCEAMHKMLQLNSLDDFIISTNQSSSIREICEIGFQYIGISTYWEGHTQREYLKRDFSFDPFKIPVKNIEDLQPLVVIDPSLYRPTDVPILIADASKTSKILEWRAKTGIKEIIEMMIDHDSKN